MRMQLDSNSPVTLAGQTPGEVSSFTYLRSTVDADERARLGKAQTTFLLLKKVWSPREIGKSTKLRIFNINVKSVLLYGSESWRMTLATLHKLQTFLNSCLRKILCIRWPHRSTEEIGLASNITRQVLTWKEGKTWRRGTETEMLRSGHSWKELEKTALSWVLWWIVVDGLCLRKLVRMTRMRKVGFDIHFSRSQSGHLTTRPLGTFRGAGG